LTTYATGLGGRGQQLLREARDVPENSRETLGQAAEKFGDAHSNYEREPDFSFWAALHVATISYALAQEGKARHWLVMAHAEAVEAIQTQCTMADRLSVGRAVVSTRHARNGAYILGGVGSLALVAFLVAAVVGAASGSVALGGSGVLALVIIASQIVKSGEEVAAVTASPLQKRFENRLAIARELDIAVDTIEGFAVRFGVDQSRLSHHELQVVESQGYIASAVA
jgi:hypothetical protein